VEGKFEKKDTRPLSNPKSVFAMTYSRSTNQHRKITAEMQSAGGTVTFHCQNSKIGA
jgi:hypothetical protein